MYDNLNNDAGRYKIAHDCHDQQACVPNFAVGLVLFELVHEQ